MFKSGYKLINLKCVLSLFIFSAGCSFANAGDKIVNVSPTEVANQQKLSYALQKRIAITKHQDNITLFVYFTDKGENLAEKLKQAKNKLSPASLHRRSINRSPENVVSFADIEVNPSYIEQIEPLVSRVRHRLKALNAVSVEATPEAIKDIAKFDFVKSANLVNKLKRSPDYQLPAAIIDREKNNQQEIRSKALALDYGMSLTQNDQISVPQVHDMGYSGAGVIIAVFDAGFSRLSHESFSQMNIADTWDFVNDDADVANGTDMGEGSHGTNTLSTIGGFSSGNLIGPAYGATYYLAKTENTESELQVEEDNWCAAAEWADTNGAQIISSSLGYNDFDTGVDYTADDMDGDTAVITKCADLVAENGIVVINSAGNSGPGNGKNTLGAPSDGNFVIAVGAVTAAGSLSSFSSVGPSADGRIKPDVMAMGSSVRVADPFNDTGYINVNGTSFSCPLTAGVAALVLESNPNLTAAQVRDILINSGDNRLTPDNSFGYGIINAKTAVDEAIAAASGSFAPSASFAVSTDGEATITLTNTSADSNGSIVTNAWDFGDGSTSAETSPSHTYTASGNYTVTLTVTDEENLTDTVSQEVSATVSNNTGNAGGGSTGGQSSSGGGGSTGFGLLFGLLILLGRSKSR